MAISEVSICNMALQSIGTRSTISSLTEQSNEAENCNLLYELTRDEVLGMAFWNFARKMATLSLIKSAPGTPTNPTSGTQSAWSADWPAPPWLFEYAYPANCIQVRYLNPNLTSGFVGSVPLMSNGGAMLPLYGCPPVPFVVATDEVASSDVNVILTNQYQALCCYTKRIADPGLYGAQFVGALKEALAAKLAMALSGNINLANSKFQMANGIILQARATDGNEGLTIQDTTPDWLQVRDIGGYDFPTGLFTSPYGALYPMLA